MKNNSSLKQTAKTGDLNADLIMRQYKLVQMAKFMEIESINPNLKQSAIARELKISSSTLQRYSRDLKMLSPYRISPTSNTHTRKQKTSNPTEHDLKISSTDLKINSNDLKITSNEAVKYMKNKLKGGMTDDNPTLARDFFEQIFSST